MPEAPQRPDPEAPLSDDKVRRENSSVEERGPLGLLRTLAVPTKARVLELDLTAPDSKTTLDALANTIALPTDELRHPSTSHRFKETYDTESNHCRELGRGGIGRVFLAFDRTLGRDVAMKELLPELLEQQSDQGAVEASLMTRFLREARITGQLEHPNIVPVYELGREPNGRLYYTMRVVRGRTLTSAIVEAKNLSERLALVNHFAGLCQAIAYAHSRGVLHRDIKPDNVMIGEFGETFVLDWGIAKIIEESAPQSLRAAASLNPPPYPLKTKPHIPRDANLSFHTESGSLVGTPLYMSPEQLLQTPAASQPSSDVWSLGVVLYYILSGKLPFEGTTLHQLVGAVLEANPPFVLTTCPEVPRDLAAIAHRALAKDPSARYPNARELAKDISAYQAGEKVGAYAYGSVDLLRRFVQRHRATAVVASASTLALATLLITSYFRIAEARDHAVIAERRATSGEQQAKSSLSEVLSERARSSVGDGDFATGALLAAGALELMERPDARGLIIALSNSERLEPIELPRLPNECRHLGWNASLRQLVCRTENQLTLAANDGLVTITDLPALSDDPSISLANEGWLQTLLSGQVVQIRSNGTWTQWLEGPRRGGFTAVTPDGQTLARGDDQGDIEIWSTNPPRRLAHQRISLPITAVALHPVEPTLSIGTYRGEILMWNWQSQEPPARLGLALSTVHALAFAPRGGKLLSGGADRSVLLWDLHQRQLSMMPFRAGSPVTTLNWTYDGSWFAVGAKSTGIDVIDAQRQERAFRVTTRNPGIKALSFTATNELLVTTDDGSALFLKPHVSAPPARFAIRSNVLSLTWSEPGERLLLGGLGDKGLCHLPLRDGVCTDKLPLRLGLVRKILHSPNGRTLAVAGTGGKVELWDAQQKLPLGYVSVPIPEVRDMAFVDDGLSLFVVGTSTELAVVDVASLRVKRTYPLSSPVQSMTLLPRSARIALGLRNGRVVLWSLKSMQAVKTVTLSNDWIMGVAASDATDRLYAVTERGTLIVLSLNLLQELARLDLQTGRPMTLVLNEEHGLLATGGENRQVQLIDAAAPFRVLANLNEHQGTVRTLLFDPKSPTLLSGGDDGMVRLWDFRQLRIKPAELQRMIEKQYGLRLDAGRIQPTSSQSSRVSLQ